MQSRTCAVLFLVTTCWLLAAVDAQFKLTILHTNDMHARFEQTSRISSKCSDKDVMNNNCYGGFPRVAYVVNEAREKYKNGQGPPVLFLNAGDNYQGSVWYSVHKWKIVADLTSLLRFDAMALGNHEFDDGVDGLVPFLKNVTFPVVAANLNLDKEPTLAATNLTKSVVLNVAGRKIGIIGYLTPETKDISAPGLVEFRDEIDSIRQEAAKLRSDGVDILIALGHSGYMVDKKIAAEIPDIDVVVGGHTNTFLYTGKNPDPLESVQGPYPTMVHQKAGRQVPVVQAYAYTKYIGRLDLTFDERGELTYWGGNPILLDKTIPQDPTVLKALDRYRADVQNANKLIVGTTKVFLRGDGKYCRISECNMGNLLADAMIYYFVSTNIKYDMGWTEAPIAMLNSGGVRADIDVSNERSNGEITMADILTTLPFENSLVFVHLKGEHILEALEWSVAKYDPQGLAAPGAFLQYSGMQVKYDICKPVDQRVVSVLVRCGDCREPDYVPLDLKKTYGVLMPTYLAQGGDGFKVKSRFTHQRILDITDTGVLAQYIKKMSPVYPGIEGRILFSNKPCAGTYAHSSAQGLVTPIIFIVAMVVLSLRYS